MFRYIQYQTTGHFPEIPYPYTPLPVFDTLAALPANCFLMLILSGNFEMPAYFGTDYPSDKYAVPDILPIPYHFEFLKTALRPSEASFLQSNHKKSHL